MIIKKYKDFILEKSSMSMPLPEDIEQMAILFSNAGKEFYVVGGCVRDFLSGKIPHDYDLVTNALPEESKKILKDWNVSEEQGKNFGVLRVFTKTEPLGYELATYRRDISKGRDTKGDDQKVEIGHHITIEDDVLRRDISINAMFYDIKNKKIIDLVGGIKDLKNNIIRAVGDPKKRFDEDRLRILRVFRFSARMKGKIDDVTSNAIKEDNRLRGISEKDDVSQERILQEWNKMREHAEHDLSLMQYYIELLFEYDMLEEMFPGLEYSEVIVTSLKNPILFYDLFYYNESSNIRKILFDLKFPNNLTDEIIFLRDIEHRWKNEDEVYNLAKYHKRLNLDGSLIYDFCDHMQGSNYYTDRPMAWKWTTAFIKYCKDGFIVNGGDLLAAGFRGKEIEIEKQRLEVERFKNEYYK